MLGSKVVFFAKIISEVVEGQFSVGGDAFPMVDADGAESTPTPEEVVAFFLFFPEEEGGERESVGFFPRFDAGEFAGGGHPIPEGGDVIAGAGFYGAGPVGDHGNADAAVVKGAFVAFEWSV